MPEPTLRELYESAGLAPSRLRGLRADSIIFDDPCNTDEQIPFEELSRRSLQSLVATRKRSQEARKRNQEAKMSYTAERNRQLKINVILLSLVLAIGLGALIAHKVFGKEPLASDPYPPAPKSTKQPAQLEATVLLTGHDPKLGRFHAVGKLLYTVTVTAYELDGKQRYAVESYQANATDDTPPLSPKVIEQVGQYLVDFTKDPNPKK